MKLLTNYENYIFSREMYTILAAGLSIKEGISLIEKNDESANLKEALCLLEKYFEQEGALTSAMKLVDAFDSSMIQLVEIGEMNGQLDRVFKELTFYYEREEYLNNQIKEATTYPFVLLCIMAMILAVLVFKILPIFENVMKNMGALQSSSYWMMHLGKGFALVAFLVLCIGIVLFLFMKQKNFSAKQKEQFLSHFILSKHLYRNIQLGNMTFALSLFISSGYPIIESLEYVANLTSSKILSDKLMNVKKQMLNGGSFSEGLRSEKIYDGSDLTMLTIGLELGEEEKAFQKLVTIYQDKVIESTTKFLNIIEPIMISLLSCIVGIILLSIMLPLMGILSSL